MEGVVEYEVIYEGGNKKTYKSLSDMLQDVKNNLNKGIQLVSVTFYQELGYFCDFFAKAKEDGILLYCGHQGQIGCNASRPLRNHILKWNGELIPL